MSKKYFVKKVEQCTKCEGRKYLQHPAWAEYWEENREKGTSMSLDEDRQWFEDHGWLGYSEDTDSVPPESYLCGECEGEGEIVSEVNLLEALPELLNAIEMRKLQVI